MFTGDQHSCIIPANIMEPFLQFTKKYSATTASVSIVTLIILALNTFYLNGEIMIKVFKQQETFWGKVWNREIRAPKRFCRLHFISYQLYRYHSASPSTISDQRFFSELSNGNHEKRNWFLPQNSESLLFLHHKFDRSRKFDFSMPTQFFWAEKSGCFYKILFGWTL